jgi:hypothetical protein
MPPRSREANRKPDSRTIAGNMALRWSAALPSETVSINIWLRWSQSHCLVALSRAAHSQCSLDLCDCLLFP